MKTWKLSTFDLFSLGMTIKGAWIYKELPAPQKLQASLETVLQPYPQMLGRYDEKLKAVLWNGLEKPIDLVDLDRRGHSVSEDMYALVPQSNTSRFKKRKDSSLGGLPDNAWRLCGESDEAEMSIGTTNARLPA